MIEVVLQSPLKFSRNLKSELLSVLQKEDIETSKLNLKIIYFVCSSVFSYL